MHRILGEGLYARWSSGCAAGAAPTGRSAGQPLHRDIKRLGRFRPAIDDPSRVSFACIPLRLPATHEKPWIKISILCLFPKLPDL